MSSLSVSSSKYFSETESSSENNSFNLLNSKNEAMCALDYLDECENTLTTEGEQTPYMKEFNSFVYLVSSRSQDSFDEIAAISRITTLQIITNNSDYN